jgi:threonyl-tRNA synthetase
MSISADSKNLTLDTQRHSMAHLLAAAVFQMFPEAQFGVGPVTDTGCFYDFILPRTLIPEDLPLIEKKMRSMLQRNIVIKKQEMSITDAIIFFDNLKQPLKVELLMDLREKGTTKLNDEEQGVFETANSGEEMIITIYRLEDETTGEDLFVDLCKGPHVGSLKELRKLGFSLDKFSASYWRGDQARDIRMQRIYALVLEDQSAHQKYLTDREEAKKYDHRVLGQQLDLFYFSEIVGSGLPLYTAKGTIIKNKLKELLFQTSKRYGALEVSIPHFANRKLYEISGHAAKFSDELFSITDHYNNDFVLKPVNCPHHTQIYAGKPRSYRDLPLRFIESTMQYRDEKPGSIGGLTRTRGFTVDDGHTFCRVDQIKDEVVNTLNIIRDFYSSMDLWGNQWVSISVRDYNHPEKYTGFPDDWDKAEAMLKEISQEEGLEGKVCEGEAALYGPKLDFMYIDAQGKERQLATVQVDFATPKRFELEYTNELGESSVPVMLHRAILGSYERFVAILLENTKGRLPFWLSPTQVKILTVNQEETTVAYVEKIKLVLEDTLLMKPLKYNEIRHEVDNRSESLGKKIREAELEKIPVIIIAGPRDIEAGQVSVRTQSGEEKIELGKLKLFLEELS